MASRAPVGKKTKAAYHHGDLRRALLDAALAQVQQEGTGSLSLREVARRAGVTHAAPYRHFPNKEALVAAVAEEGFRTLREEMLAAVDPDAPPLTRLQQSGVGYVLFAVKHPSHFRVMYGVKIEGGEEHPELMEAGNAAFAVLYELIEEGLRAGELREDPAMSLALSAWSVVHGLASLLVEGMLPDGIGEPKELARLVTRSLMEGLAVKKGSPARRRPS